MSSAQRVLGYTGLLFGACLLAAALTLQAGAQTAPLEVTSDTPAYCLRLLNEIADMERAGPAPPPEVTHLSAEGQRLCNEGQTRGGILRLRRAWLLMTHPEPDTSH